MIRNFYTCDKEVDHNSHDGEETKVTSGDMIVNKRFGTHGLVNTSNQEIELLIIQASLK
ncbi:hypothetical protein V4D09_16060 [Vibrio mimicus]|uniref:hypothetical protein n=1 Tax=Vibrio mimicus TaxID=674 RepID=UPI002F926804